MPSVMTAAASCLVLQVLVMVVIAVAFGFFAHMVLGPRQSAMSTVTGNYSACPNRSTGRTADLRAP